MNATHKRISKTCVMADDYVFSKKTLFSIFESQMSKVKCKAVTKFSDSL